MSDSKKNPVHPATGGTEPLPLCLAERPDCRGLECEACQVAFATLVLLPALREAGIAKENVPRFMETLYVQWGALLEAREAEVRRRMAKQSLESRVQSQKESPVVPTPAVARAPELPATPAKRSAVARIANGSRRPTRRAAAAAAAAKTSEEAGIAPLKAEGDEKP